jgi:outer membrane protein OmpA-like peptidoglycan-associated protein
MNRWTAIAVGCGGLWLGGCATTAPAPLNAARTAYEQASSGLAAKLAPAELYEARKALDQANREFEAYGDAVTVQDYAYIAFRKVELAEVKARTELDRQKIEEAERQGVQVREQQLAAAKNETLRTREELEAERRTLEQQRAERARDRRQLDREREYRERRERLDAEAQARAAADAKLNRAMRELQSVAQVFEDTRGVVIAMNGSVLFPFGNFNLLETAKPRLDLIAEAIKSQGDDKTVVVEGHMDSEGSNAINQPLSENRASAVREYLISAGVDARRITAVGRGSSRPITDNNTAENRALNRRIEIVIERGSVSAR